MVANAGERADLEIDIGCERHRRRLSAEQPNALGAVGHRQLNLAVEAARAAECGVDGMGPVGGAEHLRDGPNKQRRKTRLAACSE